MYVHVCVCVCAHACAQTSTAINYLVKYLKWENFKKRGDRGKWDFQDSQQEAACNMEAKKQVF